QSSPPSTKPSSPGADRFPMIGVGSSDVPKASQTLDRLPKKRRLRLDLDGAMVIRKRLRRAEVHTFLAGLEPCLIGMEAARASGDGGARLAVLPIAIRVSRPSSREAAKALIFTPIWKTSEGIPVSITRRQLRT